MSAPSEFGLLGVVCFGCTLGSDLLGVERAIPAISALPWRPVYPLCVSVTVPARGTSFLAAAFVCFGLATWQTTQTNRQKNNSKNNAMTISMATQDIQNGSRVQKHTHVLEMSEPEDGRWIVWNI